MKVYIHSDDLAATRHVSKNILESWRAGHLDGFSILANGEAIEMVQECLRQESDRPVRISAHLNLSEGRPTSPVTHVPLLIDADGFLNLTFGKLIRLWTKGGHVREQLVKQIEVEWRAQIRAVQAYVSPRKVDAVDGHMHLHMLPFLFPVAARLASEEGILNIRISKEPFYFSSFKDFLLPFYWVNCVKHFILKVCAISATRVAQKQGLEYPEEVLGILYSGKMSLSRICSGVRVAQRSGAESVEVIVHFGRALTEEAGRWRSNPAIGEFYLSEWRDKERLGIGSSELLLK